ncbi:MAG: DNA repair protein RecN (Recombination protein N) [Planctomycetota bacterium]|jgi:DNA repair protein RecN (Recombination protein N)
MLESIHIRNFAIIDSLQLEFQHGLTALTGETGAGKSILLDALKLVAGDRAESDSIRHGEDKADISVNFNLARQADAKQWLDEHELAADDECLIRRVLFSNGRSKAFINGYSATLGQLRAVCDMLIDIHGQHEHQSLQKSQVQRQLLDSFLAQPAMIAKVKQKYREFRDIETQINTARSGLQDREQRIDLLGLYCSEFNQLNLADNEFETLQQEYRRLSNASQLIEKVNAVLTQLDDDEGSQVRSILSQCEHDIGTLIETDAGLQNSHELLNAALIQVEEAITELRGYQQGIELDSSRLEWLNQRISSIQQLARKHRVDIAQLPELALELNRELEQLQSHNFDLNALQVNFEQAISDYQTDAGKLSRDRVKTAEQLSLQISEVMQELGMEGGRFQIEVMSHSEPDEFKSSGIDTIRYRVSANPGQPVKALAKVASGGELSRISLAIQVIMSESSQIPTLIFDEVDSGVGGGIAEIVGKKLRLLGKERQVLCVTHLPQVASQAHHHYRVEKTRTDTATTTDVSSLDAKDRLEEIARMLGGVIITDQTRAHANEMIAAQE